MVISDNKFIQQPANGKKYQKSDFLDISNGEKWDLKHTAELMGVRKPPPEDDPNPAGTLVEFTAPDGTLYRGRVASMSGSDYIVDVSDGEAYLVPPTKLTKVTPELDAVRRAVREQTAPTLERVAEQEELGRLLVRVAFKERRPSDGHLMEWATQHYPDLRLVDAVPAQGRNVDLIFEMTAGGTHHRRCTKCGKIFTSFTQENVCGECASQTKQAAEDVKPQGTAAEMPGERGRGISSEEIEGTGVIGMDECAAGAGVIKDVFMHPNEQEWMAELNNGHKVYGTTPDYDSMSGDPEDIKAVIAEDPMNTWGFTTMTPEQVKEFEAVAGISDPVESDVTGDKIPGGLSEKPLKEGVTVEMEHTNDPEVAKEIAMDHLVEDSKYYEKLKTIEAQLGQPGSADQFAELNDAARKTLTLFNNSNPEYYAAPQETEAFGEGENRGVRLWFVLSSKDASDKLNHLYVTRQGSISSTPEPDAKPARGFVQLEVRNGKPDMPMLMIQGPTGPESLQEYGFALSADKEAAWDDMTGDIIQRAKADPKVKAALEKYMGPVNLNDFELHFNIAQLLRENKEARAELIAFVSHLDPVRREHYTAPADAALISNWPGQQVKYQHGLQPVGGTKMPSLLNKPSTPPPSYKGPKEKTNASNKQADYDACMMAANDVLSFHGGYSAEAQAEFEARLTKLAVDPESKKYWTGYLKDYGKQFTRDIPRKKHKTAQTHKEVDPATVDYWVNYFGSSLFNDGWYGKQLVRTIPKKTYQGDGTPRSVESDDEEGVIGNPEHMLDAEEKTAQVLNPQSVTAPMSRPKKTHGPSTTRRPPYPRPATQPGFFEPGGFLHKQKTAPAHRSIEQVGELSKQLLAHARINPSVVTYIDNVLHNYQSKTPDARQKAIVAVRLQNPQYKPPAGWQVFDDTLRAAMLPFALQQDPNAMSQASEIVQESARNAPTQEQKTAIVAQITKKIAGSDYSAVIKKTDKGYEVRSPKNPNWSGGTYKSREAAEKRLQQVEMFKHMSFVMYAGTLTTEDTFAKVSECLTICDDPSEILFQVGVFAEDEMFGKKEAAQKFAKTLKDMVTEAIQKADENPDFSQDLARIYHQYMAQHPDIERKMLQGKNRRHLDQSEIAEILYIAAHERPYFKSFQKLLDRYERKDKEKTWKELSEERKKLYRERKQKERKPWLQWMKDKISPSQPAEPTPAPSPSAGPTKPWERQEPEWEDAPSFQQAPAESAKPTPAAPAKPTPAAPAKPTPPPPPAEEAKPAVPPSFGPKTERTPKEPPAKPEPAKRPPPTKEEQKTLEQVAREFGPEGKGKHRDYLESLLKATPWPKPTSKEQEEQYRKQIRPGVWSGRPTQLGMTNYEIIKYNPDFAYKYLIPHYEQQGDSAAANALRVYMHQTGIFKDLTEGIDPKEKSEKKKPKAKEKLLRWKGETPPPEISEDPKKEPTFSPSKWDDFKIDEFSGLTIPAIMKLIWDKPEKMKGFLDHMAVHYPREIIEWGKEALPERAMEAFEDNINKRRKEYMSSEPVKKPVEEAEATGGLRGVLDWKIPENTDIPAFAGDTLDQAFKKGDKKAILDYMLKDEKRRTTLLAYIKVRAPGEYQHWVDKISTMEEGAGGVAEPEKPKQKTKVFEPISSGRYKGKSVPEMMGLLRGSPEQQYEFLAEVFESDPDSYERYMQTMDSEKRKAFDQKVLEIVKGKEESPVEGEEPVAEETPGEFEDEDVEPLEEFPEDISESEDEAEDEDNDKAIRSAIHGGELQMRRWSKAGPGPFAYNAPGKDDKKDYDHKERNKQPSRSRNRFTVSRMHSTSSTRDGGYVIMEIGWDPKLFEDMSPQNIQHQVISFIKGLESDKYYHDFGITGRPRITCFDQEAGIAEAKVRCSDTRGIMTVTYCTDDPEVIVPLSGIR